jgi:GT2 family glycosyltransferase
MHLSGLELNTSPYAKSVYRVHDIGHKQLFAMNKPIPYLSIIITTWNSSQVLPKCLESLSTQTFNNFEIIIVDSGSMDESISILTERWPDLEIKLSRLRKNFGFAIANNIGARLARGKWLALLNTDAFPEPDWLENLLQAANQHLEYASFASRQIQANAPERLDGAGDVYHISGLAWRRYYNLPTKEFGQHATEVFSSCGAAALYRREDFLKAGGFDEDYFSYLEDIDLGFRLRLNGKKCLYVPEAVVHHVGSVSTGKRSNFSVYYGYRNLIWTFVKDMPSPLFWIFLPLHIGTMLFFVTYLTLRGQGKVIRKAIVDAIRGLPKMIEKRKTIQKNIKIKPSDLLKVMSMGLFEPYREFVQRSKGK